MVRELKTFLYPIKIYYSKNDNNDQYSKILISFPKLFTNLVVKAIQKLNKDFKIEIIQSKSINDKGNIVKNRLYNTISIEIENKNSNLLYIELFLKGFEKEISIILNKKLLYSLSKRNYKIYVAKKLTEQNCLYVYVHVNENKLFEEIKELKKLSDNLYYEKFCYDHNVTDDEAFDLLFKIDDLIKHK